MPRRRKATAASALSAEQRWEFAFAGPSLPQCAKSAGHDFAGHDFACYSHFESEEAREEAYWQHRDELLADGVLNGGTWLFWRYEAPSVCTHSPRCPLPPRMDFAGEFAWLDEHGRLTAYERRYYGPHEPRLDGTVGRIEPADDDGEDD